MNEASCGESSSIVFSLSDCSVTSTSHGCSVGHFDRQLGIVERQVGMFPTRLVIGSLLIEERMAELKLAQVFKKLLTDRNLSVRDVSRATGIPNSSLNDWLAGRPPKNPVHIQSLAKHLEISTHFLMFGEEDSHHVVDLNRLLSEKLFEGVFQISIKRVKGK